MAHPQGAAAAHLAAAAGRQVPAAGERSLFFPRGLYGFKGPLSFAIVALPGAGEVFKLMQSLEDPDLAFTIVDPFAFFAGYVPRASAQDMEELGLRNPEEAVWAVIATVPAEVRRTTVNLKAPLLINPFRRLAKQVILPDDYPVRQPLFGP